MKRGKKYREKKQKIENKPYSISDALSLLYQFLEDEKIESVDIAINLNADPRHADQQLRGAINLPNGGFQTKRILVFSDEVDKDNYIKMGATYVGKDEYLEKFKSGWVDFDVMITHPKNMKEIAKFGRLLGPKGLMPNPKLGTVSQDLEKALVSIVKGRAEYRTDKGGILHVQIGKTSMPKEQVKENYDFFVTTIQKMKPASVKGNFIKGIYLSTTQSPSIKLINEYN